LALQSIFFHMCSDFLHTVKSYDMGPGFTSPLKEGMLRIFIILKNPSPRLGLNPRTLSPMANILTITLPK
jgi:hypothetical protein